MTEQVTCQPRNNFVVFRIVKIDTLRGLFMPERSAQGSVKVVEGVGSKVENLKVGDEVEILSMQGSCAPLPQFPDLYITHEENVAVVIKRTFVEDGELTSKECGS